MEWADKLGIELTQDMLEIESSEFNVGEVTGVNLFHEDLASHNVKLLNYWLRNRLIYLPIHHALNDDKNGITEFDISLHQIISRNMLFSWNRFKVSKLKNYSCPVTSFAIFVHDTPIEIENHPIPYLLKQLWEEAERTPYNYTIQAQNESLK